MLKSSFKCLKRMHAFRCTICCAFHLNEEAMAFNESLIIDFLIIKTLKDKKNFDNKQLFSFFIRMA